MTDNPDLTRQARGLVSPFDQPMESDAQFVANLLATYGRDKPAHNPTIERLLTIVVEGARQQQAQYNLLRRITHYFGVIEHEGSEAEVHRLSIPTSPEYVEWNLHTHEVSGNWSVLSTTRKEDSRLTPDAVLPGELYDSAHSANLMDEGGPFV